MIKARSWQPTHGVLRTEPGEHAAGTSSVCWWWACWHCMLMGTQGGILGYIRDQLALRRVVLTQCRGPPPTLPGPPSLFNTYQPINRLRDIIGPGRP